ncbi:MAG: ABC transporter permease [Myxococcota bacterium]|nr:ABC transporter permease [Myxococcota bacterium]
MLKKEISARTLELRKIWAVIRREFSARVRTKWFVASTVMGPLLMALMVFLPIAMTNSGGGERSIAIVDASSDRRGQRLSEMLTGPLPLRGTYLFVTAEEVEAVAESLTHRVGEGELDGFLVIRDESTSNGDAEYRGSNTASQIDMDLLRRVFREAIMAERLSNLGVDPEIVRELREDAGNIRTVTIRGGEVTEQTGDATFAIAYLMWFLLYVAILLYGVQVLGAVVEDKSTRIVEVLVSSLRPFELLAGKVIGVGGVGLFQLMIWVLAGRLLLTQREALMGLFGFDASAASGVALPDLPLTTLAVFLSYFVLGFLVFAAVFAAVGSMASNESDARQLQAPVSLIYAVPAMVSLMAMMSEPDGFLFVVLSLIPLSSPVAMPGRWVVSDVPIFQIVLSLTLLVVTLMIVTWIAGRIYRVGILAYGKRPKLRELWRWVKA